MTAQKKDSTFEFKTEVKQLLHIITHSLYTNREIFLRELISNASDALEKVRFETSRSTEVIEPELPLEIRIDTDKEGKKLIVHDTGIGMTRDELIENIGTIAKSGSAKFIEQVTKDTDKADSIIGQFGVGFYSVFMVAEKVDITTRSAIPGSESVKWVSDGMGTFEIAEPDKEHGRGTTIEIHLKEDSEQFADPSRIKEIIKRHSNFIAFPILVDGETVNTTPALWREPKFEITREQYNEFYTFLTQDEEPPLETLHLSVDAPVQFTGLVFVPNQGKDVMGISRDEYGLDLHVRRVLIQHNCKELIPEYLGFVQGVVDTEDLPLNISRETLQENVLIRKINTTLTKNILHKLKELSKKEEETYTRFWKTHSGVFKLGYGDYGHRDLFAELLRFNSSAQDDAEGLTSLDNYIQNAKPEQKEIYYISGPSREAINLNPHLEIFKKKGLEVLYLFDPIDEFIMETLGTFKDFTLKSTEHADVESLESFSETKEEEEKVKPLTSKDEESFKELLQKVKEILGERVLDVKESQRLQQSPACLVGADGMSSQMQKMIKMMAKDISVPAKIMEINKNHPLIRNMLVIYKRNPDDPFLATSAEQLLESSLLMDGYLPDPHKLVERMNSLLEKSSGWYTEITSTTGK